MHILLFVLVVLAVLLTSCPADHPPADEWKVIRVCDRFTGTVPAEHAREIKKGMVKRIAASSPLGPTPNGAQSPAWNSKPQSAREWVPEWGRACYGELPRTPLKAKFAEFTFQAVQ